MESKLNSVESRVTNPSPHSVDADIWSSASASFSGWPEYDMCLTCVFSNFNKGLEEMNDTLRLASIGNHSGFREQLDMLDPAASADKITVQNSLMVFAMMDDPKGAAIIASDRRFMPNHIWCISYACKEGKLKYLYWAVRVLDDCGWQIPCEHFHHYDLSRCAGRVGTVAVLDCLEMAWLGHFSDVLGAAIKSDNRPALTWFLDRNTEKCSWACEYALEYGKLDTLKYLLDRKCMLKPKDVSMACKHGAETLDGLVSMGIHIPSDDSMCTAAVTYNNLEALEWCRRKHLTWTARTFLAALSGQTPATKEILDQLVRLNSWRGVEMSKYMHKEDTWNATENMKNLRGGKAVSRDILQYLWKNDCPRPKQKLLHSWMVKHSLKHIHTNWYQSMHPVQAGSHKSVTPSKFTSYFDSTEEGMSKTESRRRYEQNRKTARQQDRKVWARQKI